MTLPRSLDCMSTPSTQYIIITIYAPPGLVLARSSLPFNCVTHHLPYLGIQLTASLSDLLTVNSLPLLTQVTNFMTQWSSLPLSWKGQCHKNDNTTQVPLSVQSSSHPIVILLPKTNSMKSNALYMGGHQIPNLEIYPVSPQSGGLGIPNFSSYYYAAQLVQLPKYHVTKETPLWVALNQLIVTPSRWQTCFGYNLQIELAFPIWLLRFPGHLGQIQRFPKSPIPS